jgi:carbamoyl-phosphate synthase large subunit
VSEPFNVLISSAGRRVVLLRLFRKTLHTLGLEGRVLAADQSRLAAAFHDADEGFVVPACTTDAFIPAMVELCRTERVRLVVPTIDTELAAYAAHRDVFAQVGTTVAVSSPKVVGICADKQATHDWLVRHGFPTVRQSSVAAALVDPVAWPLPLAAKPRFGSASIGLSIVRTRAELAVAAERGDDMIIQDLASGEEHTLDILAGRDGRCRSVVPRLRLEVRSGEVSKAVTVRSAALIDLGRQLCEALPGAYGALNAQLFVDGDDMRVIELNPRFGGGYPLSYEAGADLPGALITELLGGTGGPLGDQWRAGVTMLRFDDAVFIELPT